MLLWLDSTLIMGLLAMGGVLFERNMNAIEQCLRTGVFDGLAGRILHAFLTMLL